ncbi:uncharacterized protein LOC135471882 isoform X2 [Liolophura sinensis]|uniref:uncharacterized protein LOC135471882 isoform X2 n=1 Tax=Liolophura sinensis TaxID=3198878 RepID=UPI003159124C
MKMSGKRSLKAWRIVRMLMTLGSMFPSPGADNDTGQRVLHRPDQIASVAASHVVRQMMLYTDLKMSVTMMDELYRAFQSVVEINREMLYDFLEESKKEMEQNKRARSSGLAAVQPLHGPVIELLVELLKHSLDPVSHVILWLLFLRTLSHFTQNMKKMVACQAAAAIMGSMAVYLEVPEVQQFGLEILCKLATYQPENNEKAPVRETGVEMIIRAMKYHEGALAILRPACRALANLALTVSGLCIDDSGSENGEAVQRRQELLSYIHKEAIPVVQDAMCAFPRDLGVQMESRRLFAVFAPEKDSSVTDLVNITEEEAISLDDSDIDSRDKEEAKPGILKSARSFENLRSPRRKVQFTAETVGGSLSSDSIFLDSIETSNRFDSGSGRFMDSFGNEMDMPDSATYIGEENMFFPETPKVSLEGNNTSTPQLIYVPPCSGSEDSDQSVTRGNDSQNRYDSFDAEIDNSVNQLSEVLIEKSSPQDSSDSTDDSMQQSKEVCESPPVVLEPPPPVVLEPPPPVVLEPPPPVPPRQALSTSKGNEIKQDRTKAEVQFLTRLMRTVITGHICSLVLSGEDSQALQAIDQPLESLLQSANVNEFLLLSMAEEYSLKKSLMDIDPVMVISIIDAVRYRSLTCDLLKSSLTELLSRMSDKLNAEVSNCAFESIYVTIADVNLEPIFLEKKFVRQMIKSLPHVQGEFLKTKVEELQAMLTDLL